MGEYIKKSEAIAKALEQLPVNDLMDNVESALMDIPPSDVVPLDWLKQFAEGKRFNYASDFVDEAKAEYERDKQHEED